MFRKEVLLVSVLLSFFLFPGVFGAINVTQPATIYNLGDLLSVSAGVNRAVTGTDYLSIMLVCESDEVILYKTPVTLTGGTQKTVSVEIPLTPAFIGELKHACSVHATYGTDEVSSAPFTISTELVLTVPGSLGTYAPGAIVRVNGTVMRRTGQSSTGTLRYVGAEVNVSGTVPITNGTYTLSFTLPETARAQAYLLSFVASEGEGLNTGTTSASVRVGQLLRELEPALSAPLVYPGTALTYSVLAYDQAHEAYTTNTEVSLLTPAGAIAHQETLSSGITSSYILPLIALPGVWTVRVQANGTEATRQFSVAVVMNASITLSNGTLTILNIGNVPYNKTVDIAIGETIEPKAINLGVGEEKVFTLEAPDGDYVIGVDDGTQSFTGRTFLAGNAISITDPADQQLVSNVSVAWILLIVLLGFAAVYYYRKISKPEYYGGAPASPSYSTRPAGGSFTFPEKKTQMIDKGERRPLPVLVVKIKNHPLVQGQVRSVVHQAVQEAHASGAILQEHSPGMWVAFFTHREGEDAVMMRAVQAAEHIQGALDEYNVKGNPAIEYGIGIHFGELIVEEKPFKYTAIGTTLPLAKKLAEYSQKTVLLSDEAHTFIASTTRCEKIHDRNAWKLKSISRRDRHNNFIKGFMKRQGFRD